MVLFQQRRILKNKNMPQDLKKLFITDPNPYNPTKFHVFSRTDNMSLCRRHAMIFVNEKNIVQVTGEEIFNLNTDCKICFKNAGLKLEQ